MELDSAVPPDGQAWTEPPPLRAERAQGPPPRVARPETPPVREPWVEPRPARGDLPEIAEDEEDIGVQASEEPVFDEPEIEAPRLGEPDVEEPVLEEPSFDSPSDDADAGDDALADLTGPEPGGPEVEAPSFDEPEIEVSDVPSLGAEEPAADEAPIYEEPPPGVSPDDLIAGPDPAQTWEAESGLEAEIEAAVDGDTGPEDLFEVATPSWGDVAATCLSLAGGRGSMLVEASGQVLAAQGDWPNPGPEAIAGRLVTMMDRALRDAPTRSVSAPLAGQHLTAWRVPLTEGLVTAVFIGDAPLKADVRPPIDDEIRRAAEA